MTALILRDVATGTRRDRVSLVDGKLTYDTGQAKSVFEGRRGAVALRGSAPSDADLFAVLTGWTNGYSQLVPDID